MVAREAAVAHGLNVVAVLPDRVAGASGLFGSAVLEVELVASREALVGSHLIGAPWLMVPVNSSAYVADVVATAKTIAYASS